MSARPTRATDRDYMARAIELAGRGRPHPNPRVGAVLVRRGRIVGEGYHRACGAPHAEAVALARAGSAARGATLYVTLEPCNHQGRTPACAPAVAAAGVRRLVVAARDPNPLVRGKGLRLLRRTGIEVTVGLLGARAGRLNEAYDLYHRLRRPLVELKLATTLDGRIALRDGRSQWITGPGGRRIGHALRAAADCVLVGAETVRRDDPALTVRHVRGVNPVRVVITSALDIPSTRRIFSDGAAPTAVLTARAALGGRRAATLRRRGIELIPVRRRGSRLDLRSALEALADRYGARRVLVEGGGQLGAGLLRLGLVDRLHLLMAPAIMGDEHRGWSEGLGVRELNVMPRLSAVCVTRVGDDCWIRGDLPGR